MDAFSLIPEEQQKLTPDFWIGKLSTAVGLAAERDRDKWMQNVARECLAEFIASPVPHEDLRKRLRGYLK